jgi:hypothetical protein
MRKVGPLHEFGFSGRANIYMGYPQFVPSQITNDYKFALENPEQSSTLVTLLDVPAGIDPSILSANSALLFYLYTIHKSLMHS